MADLFSQAGSFEPSDSTGSGATKGNLGGRRSASAEQYFHPGTHAPLAVRMRPRDLDEVVGQDHVLGKGTPLRRLVEGHGDSSVILFGPPGTGKTTIASLVSAASGRHFVALSALDSGVKQVREVIDEARRRLIHGERTVLFIDEVHRFSKTQRDALLAAVENRTVLLVAATTENPSFSVVSPLLSRSLLVTLQPLAEADIEVLVQRALTDPRGYDGALKLEDAALAHLVAISGGDARRSLTYLEAAAEDVLAQHPEATSEAPVAVTVADVQRSTNKAVVRYDRDGDQHYDVTSAFIKSIRGSDPDAALHYLARMLEGGEDPRFIARRLTILASEDIGTADHSALQVAVAAHQAVSFIGMPEARITLAHATVHLATSPKSNAAYLGIGNAIADIQAGRGGPVPPHLRDGHYSGAKALGHAVGYKYPHDDPLGVLQQQYLPDDIADAVYYKPTNHGHERTISARLDSLRGIVRGFRRNK